MPTDTITATGDGTYTVPTGVTSIDVACRAGGGGGEDRDGSLHSTGGKGGGGGAFASKTLTVTPGDILNYHNGAGGSGAQGATTDGEDTWFKSTSDIKAVGGQRGALGGAGGTAASSVGTTKHSGGSGANPGLGSNGGGGGGGAGSTADGSNGAAGGAGGGGGSTGGGTGGAGGTSGNSGSNGNVIGAGGGGAGSGANLNGGNGARGEITVTYTALSATTTEAVSTSESVTRVLSLHRTTTESVSSSESISSSVGHRESFTDSGSGDYFVYNTTFTGSGLGDYGYYVPFTGSGVGDYGYLFSFTDSGSGDYHSIYQTFTDSGVGDYGYWVSVSNSGSGDYRVANNIAGFVVWIGSDVLPDLTTAPTAYSATLPISIPIVPPGVGTTTFYVVVRRRNHYDLVSQNQRAFTITVDSAGNRVLPPLPVPQDVKADPQAGGKIRLRGRYPGFGLDDPAYTATSWKLWLSGAAINPAVDTPTRIVNISGSVSQDFAGFTPGTYNYVVGLYRSPDGALSYVAGTVTYPAAPSNTRGVYDGADFPNLG
jgi:hypothetical protein